MDIKIFNRWMAQNKAFIKPLIQGKYVWISIESTDCFYPRPAVMLEGWQSTETVVFSDITQKTNILQHKLMDHSHASVIINFIEAWRRHIDQIFVHCDEGVSRSPAVGVALDLWLNKKDSISSNNKYFPNLHVKTIMLEELRKRGQI